ncbi:replication/maintenance protein RepL [Vibrio cholerae]
MTIETPKFTETQLNLNNLMFNNPKIFNKDDNTFLVTSRDIAKELGLSSHTTVVRQQKRLKELELAKPIKCFNGQEVLMISPWFYCKAQPQDRLFIEAIYTLGSYKKALDLDLLQREVGYNIDPQTGMLTTPYDYTVTRKHKVGLLGGSFITDEVVYQKFQEIKYS